MLLGVAFTNLLSAVTCCKDIDSNNNPINQNHSDSISYLTHMDKILSIHDENNKTMPIYQQNILGQPNYLLNLHATKKDILKRAILSEDIILKQKLDIEEIFNKQKCVRYNNCHWRKFKKRRELYTIRNLRTKCLRHKK